MKRWLSAFLVAMLMIAVSVPGMAAPAFDDVPRDHWAYPAIESLVKAGLVDGYSDGTFRGDKPVSRYEMAQIVGKAAAKMSKATFEQKALIEKLGIEFALELNNLTSRVAKVEAKTNTWLVGGDARFRYFTNHPKYPGATKLHGSDSTDFRFRVKFAGNINENTTIQGRFSTNYGVKFGNTEQPAYPWGSTAFFDIFNITRTNALGLDSIRLGRSPLDFIGYGLIGKPMAVDGITLKKTLGDAKFTAFTGNIKTDVNAGTGTGDSGNANQLTTAQVAFKVSDDFKMGVGYYWADIPGTSTANNGTLLASAGASFNNSKGYDLSFNYKLGKLTLLADYVATTLSTPVGLPGNPKAWVVQLSNGTGPSATGSYYHVTSLLVNPAKRGTDAWSISYRSVDPGAIPASAGGFDNTAIAYNQSYNVFTHGTDNAKAIYLVYQNVIDKDVVLSFEWQKYKIKNRALVSGMTSDDLDTTFMTRLDYYF